MPADKRSGSIFRATGKRSGSAGAARAPGALATRVLAITRMIPAGKVATYGDIAEWAGVPRAARAVGTIMATSHVAGVPYHRVVAAGGTLGGYGGHEATKRGLLQLEGVVVVGKRIRGFAAIRWSGPRRRPRSRRTNGRDHTS